MFLPKGTLDENLIPFPAYPPPASYFHKLNTAMREVPSGAPQLNEILASCSPENAFTWPDEIKVLPIRCNFI